METELNLLTIYSQDDKKTILKKLFDSSQTKKLLLETIPSGYRVLIDDGVFVEVFGMDNRIYDEECLKVYGGSNQINEFESHLKTNGLMSNYSNPLNLNEMIDYEVIKNFKQKHRNTFSLDENNFDGYFELDALERILN